MAIYFVSADWIIIRFSFNSEFWEHSLQQWVPSEQDTDLRKPWRDKDLHPSPDLCRGVHVSSSSSPLRGAGCSNPRGQRENSSNICSGTKFFKVAASVHPQTLSFFLSNIFFN